MSSVSGPYKVLTVSDNTMKAFEDGTENTISIDWETKAPGLQEDPGTNGDNCYTMKEPRLSDPNETKNEHNELDNSCRQTVENGDTKYVTRWN